MATATYPVPTTTEDASTTTTAEAQRAQRVKRWRNWHAKQDGLRRGEFDMAVPTHLGVKRWERPELPSKP